jgi:hypothetical protein
MNLTHIEEREFGRRIRDQLNAGTNRLERPIVDQLHAARQAALAHHHTVVSGELSLAGFGRQTWNWCEDNLRPFLLAASLVVAVVCGNYVVSVQRINDLEDIDSAVLADDLPLSAYLDNGFHSWLADSSSQR